MHKQWQDHNSNSFHLGAVADHSLGLGQGVAGQWIKKYGLYYFKCRIQHLKWKMHLICYTYCWYQNPVEQF